MKNAAPTKAKPVRVRRSLFLRDESGQTRRLSQVATDELYRELSDGRGGTQVTALVLQGYVAFMGDDGHDVPLSELRAEHIR